MKILFSTTLMSALIGGVAVPAMVVAQPVTEKSEIVVTAKNQKLWDEGNKLEQEGLEDLVKAKSTLIKYSARVVDDQNNRETSRQQADNASAEFRNLTLNPPTSSDPGEAELWADKVYKAARAWNKHDDNRLDSRSDFSKNSKRQANAQRDVDRAQADVDKGRAMKAEAERKSISPN